MGGVYSVFCIHPYVNILSSFDHIPVNIETIKFIFLNATQTMEYLNENATEFWMFVFGPD